MFSSDPPTIDKDLPAHLLQIRNQERVELIMSFYRGLKEFRDLSRKSRSGSQAFRFSDMDRLIEAHLRTVKDTCHRLFRESRRDEATRILQIMFDMYFGILFHILLKAKENLRLRENYNLERLEEMMEKLRTTGKADDLPSGVNQLFDHLAEEFERDSQELEGEMMRARFMFTRLERIFNRIIEVYSDNPVIIRNLYCQRELFADLFPREGIDRIFARIYRKNGPPEAYIFLGFDYLRSGHTERAREAFALAIKKARQRRTPARRLHQIYWNYREKALADLHEAGQNGLDFQLRLREIEDAPPLRALLRNSPEPPATPAAQKKTAPPRIRPTT